MLSRFDGRICGLGTTSGLRVVVGIWSQSPLGSFADAMVETPQGHRVLLAPSEQVAAFVAATYSFDEVLVTPVAIEQGEDWWRLDSTVLTASWTLGERSWIGHVLRLVPAPVRTARWWARLCDPVARRLMPGVRTYGTAGGGRTEWYAARDAWTVRSARVTFRGEPAGALAPLDPPVRFGFGSAPRVPTHTALSSFVDAPAT